MRRMRIRGMTCEGCNETVAEALAGAGATDVRADFRTGVATFQAGPASSETLSVALEQAGYEVLGIDDALEPTAGPDHRRGPEPRAEYDLLIVGSGARRSRRASGPGTSAPPSRSARRTRSAGPA
jgi:mercuric reductase